MCAFTIGFNPFIVTFKFDFLIQFAFDVTLNQALSNVTYKGSYVMNKTKDTEKVKSICIDTLTSTTHDLGNQWRPTTTAANTL